MDPELERVLIDADQIAAKVAELGRRITHDYAGKSLLLVGVLKGSVPFLADLARHIDLDVSFDFIAVSSYGDASTSSGVVRFLKDLDQAIEGRHILIVEDIVDTGLTLHYLRQHLLSRHPASLKVCCLLDKASRRQLDVSVEYVGFTIPDYFVVGYGLDYAGKFRNLPYVAVLKQDVTTAET